MKFLLLVSLYLCPTVFLLAQNNALPDLGKYRQTVGFKDPIVNLKPLNYSPEPAPATKFSTGKLEAKWIVSPDVARLTTIYRRNEAVVTKGFRVQIYNGNNSEGATKARELFVDAYHDMPLYSTFEKPTFKVRVGNFRTRYEAEKFAREISKLFPSAFVAPDQVKLGN